MNQLTTNFLQVVKIGYPQLTQEESDQILDKCLYSFTQKLNELSLSSKGQSIFDCLDQISQQSGDVWDDLCTLVEKEKLEIVLKDALTAALGEFFINKPIKLTEEQTNQLKKLAGSLTSSP